ncbi:MAG: amidohydrolase family protein [Bacteriovoracaceae bacterium]
MALQKLTFYRATIVNPLGDKKCEYIADGVLVVKGHKIKDLLSYAKAKKLYGPTLEKNLIELKDSAILPGFFDMHFHWVQEDVRQMPKDSLLSWLEKYTFPTEAKYASKAYAEKKAKVFFDRLAHVGTLGGACYSSVHEHAVTAAMKYVKGDFVIGNVLMNMNSPKNLTQTESESLSLTKRLLKRFGRRHAFTPRFAITTTPKVMKAGSHLADRSKAFKQTHLSETPQEIEFVLSLYRKMPGFEDVKSYTEIYERTGMLGKRSLMGHGIHLSPKELQVLRKTETAVIHCPTSNAPLEQQGLGSGLFDFHMIEKAKVRWALGSDIGGGPFLSMFDVMRSFVEQNEKKQIPDATFVKALYRATLAGAEIMEVAKKTGNLSPGKEASFIVVPLKGGARANAEETLKAIVTSHAEARASYEEMVEFVAWKGRVLFDRPGILAK